MIGKLDYDSRRGFDKLFFWEPLALFWVVRYYVLFSAALGGWRS